MQLPDVIASALFVAGIATPVAVAILVAVSRRVYAAKAYISQGTLVLDYGRYGRLVVPLGSVVSVKRVENPGRGVRLAGISVPGRVYFGSFHFKRLGTVFMASDRPRDLVLVELEDGRKLLLGYNVDRLYDTIRREAGYGPKGSMRVEVNARLVKYSTPLYAAAVALLVTIAILLPGKFTLLGGAWSRTEGLIVAAIFTALHLLDMLLFYALSTEVLGLQLLVVASAMSTLLVNASILLAGIAHPIP